MKVELTVHVRTDGGVLLARQDEEVRARLDVLLNCVDWGRIGSDVATAALDKADATRQGMVCPDDHN